MLSDVDIHKRIEDFNFIAENSSRPFDANGQVNPASVNLRLSNTYWQPKSVGEVVSFKPDAFGSETVDRYKKLVLKDEDEIVLKPGQTILCRTYERFRIPTDLAGRLHSRSSFSRLGIDVAGTADFINPGWEGYMPLVIRNNSKNDVHLEPFMSIVQLCFDELSSQVKTPYLAQESIVKYDNDEGGPSAIWQSLCRKGLNSTKFSTQQNDIDLMIHYGKKLNPPTLKTFLKQLPELSKLETAGDVASTFSEKLKSELFSGKYLR